MKPVPQHVDACHPAIQGKVVYLSGPITGVAAVVDGVGGGYIEGYAAHFAAAKTFAQKSWAKIVLNPAELPKHWSYKQYMLVALALVADCDTVLLLDGWRKSKGACAEAYTAHALGKTLLAEQHRPDGSTYWTPCNPHEETAHNG